jgi:hypothetical protein
MRGSLLGVVVLLLRWLRLLLCSLGLVVLVAEAAAGQEVSKRLFRLFHSFV